MSNPILWELKTPEHILGHIRWLGGPLLICALPPPLSQQVIAWFYQSFRRHETSEIALGDVRVFVRDQLPIRLPKVRITPCVASALPPAAGWLGSLTPTRAALQNEVDTLGWRSNRWPEAMPADMLSHCTKANIVTWQRQLNGSFSAGGWCVDGSEQWLDLSLHRGVFTLVVRNRGQLLGRPQHSKSAWFWKSPHQKLHTWLNAQLP